MWRILPEKLVLYRHLEGKGLLFLQRGMSAKIFGRKGLCGLFCGLILAVWATAHAELYYYRDENGVLYLTNIPTNHHFSRSENPTKREGSTPINRDLFYEIAALYGLDPALLMAVAKAESDFDPKAVSHKGAKGLMQLMPETASDYQVQDVFDPRENLRGAAAFLRDLLDEFGDLRLALAAYNAGPEKVRRYRGIPPYPETRAYVRRVLRYYALYKRQKNYKFLSQNP